MKKLLLGLAVSTSACLAFPAQAVRLSNDGRGEVLLFPYYTVNSGNQTLISIVNSTDRGKATRLFFREGRNSRVVMELSIYLAPFDVWTGSVFSVSPLGSANLMTTDHSCTVPALRSNASLPQLSNGNPYAPFSNTAYTGANNDAGPDDIVRTREGHFELIEMGEVTNVTRASLTALTHQANGFPANCTQLEQAWAPGGYWQANSLIDMAPPGGGLYGSAFYVDALGGTMQAVVADAIENFSDRILHDQPGVGRPTLADANTSGPSTAPYVNADVFVDGLPVRLVYPLEQAIDAVSAVLMADEIHNEFVTRGIADGASEWVVTFPTKHFYTDRVDVQAIAPFTNVFSAIYGNAGSAPAYISAAAWTRGGVRAACIVPYYEGECGVVFSPPPPPPQLAWATNVIGFNQPTFPTADTAIFGSRLSDFIEVQGTEGSDPFETLHEVALRMLLWRETHGDAISQQQLRPDIFGRRLRGLPVQGFWVASYTNGQLVPGVLSNYSEAVRHQSRASLSSGSL
jgi:hypothetical protein